MAKNVGIHKALKDVAAHWDRSDMGDLAGDAVVSAAGFLEGAEAVARRTGLTKRDGTISKVKLARAALKPVATGRKLLTEAADEVQQRRQTRAD